jgi:hypothetical protein
MARAARRADRGASQTARRSGYRCTGCARTARAALVDGIQAISQFTSTFTHSSCSSISMQRDSKLRGSEHLADADGGRALQLKRSSKRGDIDPQPSLSTLHS